MVARYRVTFYRSDFTSIAIFYSYKSLYFKQKIVDFRSVEWLQFEYKNTEVNTVTLRRKGNNYNNIKQIK
jgi:hypothetical protein